MLKTGQATHNQRLYDVNICLFVISQPLVSVSLQNASYLQEYGASNHWAI